MPNKHTATLINNIANRTDTNLVTLDINTPCGIFETNGGSRYIITQHGGGKVAIGLRHRFERPFIWTRLTGQPSAEGRWHGKARVIPTRSINLLSGHLPIGAISSDNRVSRLLCRTTDGGCDWIRLGQLWGEPSRQYDRWHIVIDGKTIFEQRPVTYTV